MADKTQTTDQLIKDVCRAIASYSEVISDERWESKWKCHTDPHTVAMGGPWSTIQRAREIIDLVRKAHDIRE